MNLIKIMFIIYSLYLAITGTLFYFCKNYLPNILKQAFAYGRFSEKKQSPYLLYKIEVPKKWFRHFYVFSAPLSIYALFITVNKYFYDENISESVYLVLDFLIGSDRKPLVPLSRTILALTLMTIQTTKRFYESHCVNVFSDGRMNISHYFVGQSHYFGLIVVILGESEGFVKGCQMNFHDSLKIKDWIGALVFLWMSYQQLQTNFILSNLRKDKKGVVVTKEHKIPRGGLFDYISAPLQFTEIGMYGALQIILCENKTYFFVCFWVFTNQFITGLLSHQWHKKTFKDYPPARKIIIPYLL